MGRKTIVEENQKELQPIRRAIDPEQRTVQMIALAENEAERLMREGKAPAQVICHYLKLGTKERELELEKLKNENLLLVKKAESLESTQRLEQMMAEGFAAMKHYRGDNSEEE